MKTKTFFAILFLLAIFFPKEVLAVSQISFQNNKFGIHLAIATKEELIDAAKLVNESGDWGYVTVVIQENDKDLEKWQDIFDKMRELHLIPIVRIAASPAGDYWQRPDLDQVDSWVNFLDSLCWVVKNRYLVLFNEPNHGSEWGGEVDPQSFAAIVNNLSRALKERSDDFYIMMAGFDAAAPSQPPKYEDEAVFLNKMDKSVEGGLAALFENLDGWASHSYPNHGFVGSPYGTGRNSIETYLWELELLRKLGVSKDLPVFITETGWPHLEGVTAQKGLFSAGQVTENFSIYFGRVILDPKVVAVTPFILNYQAEPFDHFSWKKLGDQKDFYPQYEQIKGVKKVIGNPIQEQDFSIKTAFPEKFIQDSTYKIPLIIKNEGQAIWDKEDGYRLKLFGDIDDLEYFFSDFSNLKPFEETLIQLHLKVAERVGRKDIKIAVFKQREKVSPEINWPLEVVPAIDLSLNINLFPKLKSSGDDFTVLIYNDSQEVVFEKSGIVIEKGKGTVSKIHNLIIDNQYRVVVLKPNYLPRQIIITLEGEENRLLFRKMFPVDFNKDGKLSFDDVIALAKEPSLFGYWWLK